VKTTRLSILLIFFITLLLLGASCSQGKRLSGEYWIANYSQRELVGYSQGFEFSGNEVIDYNLGGIGVSGTYEINDDRITLRFNGPFSTVSKNTYTFVQKGNSIWLNNVEFRK
jgi:hypothetical protein